MWGKRLPQKYYYNANSFVLYRIFPKLLICVSEVKKYGKTTRPKMAVKFLKVKVGKGIQKESKFF
jgi:hypothetical protein